ncbi:MAG TPA: hypothetical protein VGJ57_11370 [Nitrospirales bacterium]|jgi:hypothetical protein
MNFVTSFRTCSLRPLLITICPVFVGVLLMADPSRADSIAVALDPTKSSKLKGSIPGDFTQNEASITYHWEGSSPGVALQTFDPAPTTFKLGTGSFGTPTGRLADQFQSSRWEIQGKINRGNTIFVNPIPGFTGPGFFAADADLDIKPGTSLARTAFKVAGGFDGGTVKITGENTKDDAFVESDFDTVSHASGSLIFALGGATALDVETLLQAQLGATASLLDDGPNAGLSLLAAPGQLAAFSVVATDAKDPSQSFRWSATFNGVGRPMTAANGVTDPGSFFTPVPGGWFLPFDAMPGHDLTADLGSGDLQFTGVASVDISSVPEPSTLLCFTTGLAMVFSYAWRHRKQSV